MKKIMLATTNAHKVDEFKQMLSPFGYEVKSLLDMERIIEIEETGTTFEENALIKAQAIHDMLGIEVIADDSGLMVNALDGQPGIYSARYLGRDTAYTIKNRYIINECNKGIDRGCQYVCAIAYVRNDGTHKIFRGVLEGSVAYEEKGTKGFGYDPMFYYPPFQTTLADVSDDEKNKISHRGLALQQFLAYLEEEA